MMTRPPLNGRLPRTLQDATRDPFDYLEHHRASLLLRVWRPAAQILFVVTLFGGTSVLAFLYLAR